MIFDGLLKPFLLEHRLHRIKAKPVSSFRIML
jgi:hypothetical protein